jgi:hypothetical protein
VVAIALPAMGRLKAPQCIPETARAEQSHNHPLKNSGLKSTLLSKYREN